MPPVVSSRVTINPAVRSGQPIIRGTRTTVADILSLLAAGAPQEEILSDFPWLETGDIKAALEYAAEHNQLLASQKNEYTEQVEEGWLAARRGEFVDGDEVFDRIDSELASAE